MNKKPHVLAALIFAALLILPTDMYAKESKVLIKEDADGMTLLYAASRNGYPEMTKNKSIIDMLKTAGSAN